MIWALLGGNDSQAYAINDLGQVVGSSGTDIDGFQHAFVYSNGLMSDLGTLPDRPGSTAYAINANGQIAGSSDGDVNGTTHAFLYANGNMIDLDPNGTQSQGYGINSLGQVVGYAAMSGRGHGALFSNGNIADLGSDSQAFGINTSGQIAGFAFIPPDYPQRAVLYSGGTQTDLGTLGGTESVAYAINASGQIVGHAKTPNNADQHAFLYSGGAMYDLNSVLPASSFPMLEARGINDAGQIAATGGPVNGQFHAFLLRPITSTTTGSTVSSIVPPNSSYVAVPPVSNNDTASDMTTVSLLGGTATSQTTVNITFTGSTSVGSSFQAASDLVNVSGTGSDTVVLQVSYNEAQAISVFGTEGDARLMWLDPSDNQWKLAVAGNTGGTAQFVNRAYNPATDFQLGYHGVDTVNNVVWAVINHNSYFAIGKPVPVILTAKVQQPINADGSSVFSAKRGVVPVKFTLSRSGSASCVLPPATIALTRTAGTATGVVNETAYSSSADSGSSFRIDSCQYIYNLSSSALGAGTYRVDIKINESIVGSAIFQLK